MSSASLRGASLTGCRFAGADLSYADLRYANVGGKLTGDDTGHTDFRGATLLGARLDHLERAEDAHWDEGWPA